MLNICVKLCLLGGKFKVYMCMLDEIKTGNQCSEHPAQEVRKRVTSSTQRKPKKGTNKYEGRN